MYIWVWYQIRYYTQVGSLERNLTLFPLVDYLNAFFKHAPKGYQPLKSLRRGFNVSFKNTPMNKSKLKERAKNILNGFPINHVFDSESIEHKFLNRLFEGHPEYSIKSGIGIKNISIGIGGKFKTRCFIINRKDETFTDISYIRSVDGATSKISDIKCACRSAIDPIIIEFKKGVRYGVDACQITGELLTKDNTHIDHYNLTFDELFSLWIKDLSIDLLHSLLNDSTIDNATSIYFKSEIISTGFAVFHNDNTNLRAVTKQANLSILTRKKHD